MPSLQPQFSPEHLAAVKRYQKLEDLLPSHWSESRVSANGLRHHYYRMGGEKPQLVLLGNELWSRARQQYEEARRLQRRITCLVLLLYSEHYPRPGTPVTMREEPAERPNEKIVRIEHTGHLIYREHF